MAGPLDGVKVLEFAGLGPGPFCGMLLADMGADVVRLERTSPAGERLRWPGDVMCRGRRSVAVDLKAPAGVATAIGLADRAEVLIEGYRPGVMERLGLGPDVLLDRNPALVYGRMTGWGQVGPLATTAGHDIDYLAVSGVLHAIGPAGGEPVPPLNLVGDFGGGGMLLAFGIVCALLDARRSGRGQVIDAAMVDGAALLATMVHGFAALGKWREERGANLLDGGAPFYRTYRTADGNHVAVGAIEPRFYATLLRVAGIDEDPAGQMDRARWPVVADKLARAFAGATRDEWCERFAGTDACVAPVLTMSEAVRHPQNVARATFIEVDGEVQPAPAPRLSRTPASVRSGIPRPGEHTRTVLLDWGVTGDVRRRSTVVRPPSI